MRQEHDLDYNYQIDDNYQSYIYYPHHDDFSFFDVEVDR